MIQNNKKFFAVYAVWVAIHLYLYLSGGGKYQSYYKSINEAREVFFPLPSGFYTGAYYDFNDWYSLEYYDYTELFVYSVAPLLLLFLYKAFIEKKK